MADVVFVAAVIAFFAVAALYVRACAALVGPEAALERADDDADEVEATA